MTDSITAKPWTISMHGDDFHIDHDKDGRLAAVDAVISMPRWAPALIRTLFDRVNELRRQVALIAAGTAETVIRPISTAPHENTYVDIWVKDHGGKATRVPNAYWSEHLSDPADRYNSTARYTGWHAQNDGGRNGISYLDKHEQVVGWSPIPKWKNPQ